MGKLILRFSGYVALITLAGWPLVESVAERFAGRIAPVVAPMQIRVIKEIAPDETLFRFEAQKLRNCGFIFLEAWLGIRGDPLRVPVKVEYLGGQEMRGAGHLAPPDFWRVSLSARDLLSGSHIDALHNCPGRPWRTRTPFFDPPPPDGDGTEQAP